MNFNFSLRERIILIAAACFLVPLLIYQMLVSPIQSVTDLNNRKITNILNKYEQASLAVQEIKFYKTSSLARPAQTDVVLRNIISEMSLTNDAQIRTLTSSEQDKKYLLTVNNIRNDQLVDLLYKIENNVPVIIVEKLAVVRDFRNAERIKVELNLRSE